MNTCRGCNYQKSDNHTLISHTNLCQICNSLNFSKHIILYSVANYALECNNCHNYIEYIDPYNNIWKDQVYLDNDIALLRFYDDKTASLWKNMEKIYTFKKHIDISNYNLLFNKIKTIMIFL